MRYLFRGTGYLLILLCFEVLSGWCERESGGEPAAAWFRGICGLWNSHKAEAAQIHDCAAVLFDWFDGYGRFASGDVNKADPPRHEPLEVPGVFDCKLCAGSADLHLND